MSSANLDLLSERGRKAIISLTENDVNGSQSHVYGDWPEPGIQDEDKQRLTEQVCTIYASKRDFYGLTCCITKRRSILINFVLSSAG